MGLLLSVLVACVGVVELITFYFNVQRNLTLRPVSGDLSPVKEGYIQGLHDVRKRIVKDLQNLQNETSDSTIETSPSHVQRPTPTLRLNSHEDIEIEYNQNVLARANPPSPRRFLVTEKEAETESRQKSPSPRRFVVSEEPQGIQKSKCKSSIPEFLIQEQNNPKKSPNHPRYVLKDHEGRSRSPIPLPSQFVVTEKELDIAFQDNTSKPGNENSHIRSSSPYPPLDLPQAAKISNDLVDHPVISVVEVDEELCRSRSPSPRNLDSSLAESNFDSPLYWRNKVLVVPSKKSKSRSPCGKKHTSVSPHASTERLETPKFERTRSKSESESNDHGMPIDCVEKDVSNSQTSDWSDFTAPYVVLEEEDFQENTKFDENYLNSLDGVSKQKSFQRNCSSRRTIKRTNIVVNDLEKASSSLVEESTKSETTTNNLVNAVNELKEAPLSKAIRETPEVASSNKTTDNKLPEPFWLIFSGEYTKAMNKDWHGQHFCCWQCDESLTGQRYVLRDDHPYCVSCYESVFANACEKCSRTIGIDSKDLSYKDKHWHEACFLCTSCGESLVDKQFGSKGDRIYCGNCYDQQFASRCDGCHEIFRAGTKKMEYKTRQWHEKCFCCCVCKVPIGTQSFIPREQEIYCAKCYEEKFATRCIKCNKVITSGGVTYKNEPWHRECFTCTHCQKSLAGERFTSRDEKPFCAECFGELFAKRCTACNKPITGIGGTKFISFEDRHWHNDCFFCASCRTSLVGRGFITDQEDIICPECAKQKLM